MNITKTVLDYVTPAGQNKGRGPLPDRKRPGLLTAAIVSIAIAPFLPFIDNYWIDIGFYFGIYTLLGLSLNIVLGEVGLFDLGHTGFYAIGAYVTAILNTTFHIPILVLLPVSALVAGLFAWMVTAPVIHLKGDYLCIVTIGIGEIVRLTMINNPFGLTGGPNGINGIDTPVFIVPIVSSRQFYYLIWALIAIVIFGLVRLQRSRVGRAWNYIREDEVAAEALGINVRHYKLAAFVLGAGIAGMAGNIYASKQMSVSPESFTFMESSLLFCIVLLGGLGSIPGTVLGALAITIFPEIFRPLAQYRLMFFGLALLVMMIFKPAGLMPRQRESGEKLRSALSKKRREAKGRLTGNDGCRKDMPPPGRAENLLEVKDVHLSFGGVTAVAGIDAEIEAGKITALIGPNGAGKTTLFNLITGIYKPQAGSIRFNGEDISGQSPHAIAGKGIARTFQNIRLFPSLTCLENVLSGQHCRGKAEFTASLLHLPSQQDEETQMLDFSLQCLDRVGLSDSTDKLAASLPYGKRRYLEIARALALRPELIVLDEPSSGLNDAETEELAQLLLSLLHDGLSVLLIEHDMHLVDRVSDHVIVMQSGKKIAEGKMCDMRKNPLVIEAYLGTEED
ncbi:ABC transporter, ATP-binding protein [uncultured spirochete]|uniref:ABC transporter, ATP-binding protein n=1 Tax=uncultured spirochete TaxID=156406 RepID=A0A3P3XQ60_9SPIR|nr:ABC transporter, ATP-binding protein [uncultured spirochete]